jgi:hypothetical protein
MNNPPVFIHDPPLGEGFVTLWTCWGQPENEKRKRSYKKKSTKSHQKF